jgi:hypothetical protein
MVLRLLDAINLPVFEIGPVQDSSISDSVTESADDLLSYTKQHRTTDSNGNSEFDDYLKIETSLSCNDFWMAESKREKSLFSICCSCIINTTAFQHHLQL